MTESAATGAQAPAFRVVFSRHAAAWLFLAGVGAADVTYPLLPQRGRAAVLDWASTSVANLEHHPVGSLVASAFFPGSFQVAWLVLIALAVFPACSVLGTGRTAVTCTVGQVLGTVVSEGIVAWRVAHGSLPVADTFLLDVGPSYVVVAAIAVALLHGGWLARAAAAADLVVLIFVGKIFAGLSALDLAAVGHFTALVAGAVTGTLLARIRRPAITHSEQITHPHPAPG